MKRFSNDLKDIVQTKIDECVSEIESDTTFPVYNGENPKIDFDKLDWK